MNDMKLRNIVIAIFFIFYLTILFSFLWSFRNLL